MTGSATKVRIGSHFGKLKSPHYFPIMEISSASDSPPFYGDALAGQAAPGAYAVNQRHARRCRQIPKGQELVEQPPIIQPPVEQPIIAQQESQQLEEPERNDEPKPTAGRATKLVSFVLVLLVAVAVAVGLVLGTRSDKQDALVLSAPSYAPAFDAVEAMSLLTRLSPFTSFDDPESPPSQALEWLVSDPYIHSIIGASQDVSGNRLLQRFALATLWYSTIRENGVTTGNWLEAINECEWHHLLCKGPQIVEINLQENNLVGTMPAEISLLGSLEVLDLSYNIIDNIPSQMGELSSLRVLELNGISYSGSIPEAIGTLSTLEVLSMSFNFLVGSIPAALGQLSNLKRLQLTHNQLTGTIPPTLFQNPNLRVLDLSVNRLTGTLPSEISMLTNAIRLSLSWNDLTGQFPTALGLLSKLTVLNLRHNYLSGTIPADLGGLTSLSVLDISSNRINGTIALGRLTELESFLCSHNELSGTVPAETFTHLTQLKVLEIQKNYLVGSIPPFICSHVHLCVDCDAILCECCRCSC